MSCPSPEPPCARRLAAREATRPAIGPLSLKCGCTNSLSACVFKARVPSSPAPAPARPQREVIQLLDLKRRLAAKQVGWGREEGSVLGGPLSRKLLGAVCMGQQQRSGSFSKLWPAGRQGQGSGGKAWQYGGGRRVRGGTVQLTIPAGRSTAQWPACRTRRSPASPLLAPLPRRRRRWAAGAAAAGAGAARA